ncbi:NTP hydrolase p-loop-containing [Desulfonema limicola]|uniref:NTP hydrolase p-loop-containing n=1 Tax=Desulfonema limicola TaxID=45656 RepID=A0A975BAZ7_9BACT|nr:hypothetical protein [Desulfonema limicola]QTA81977.1 NTP hydrolase p-loop-containing [Desulfonema limicola]
MPYNFPVTNKFEARAVTELDFEIDPMDEKVYVDLDSVRGKEYLEQIKFNLNIDEDKLHDTTDSFTKIIFSGHRGTGKSIELQRFQQYIDDPDRYFSIHIEIEKEFEVAGFQSEDIFVILIANLIEKVDEAGIDFYSDFLSDILSEWLSEEIIQKELKDNFKVDIGSEAEAGVSFFGFLKLKSSLKAIFSSESNTSKTIRRTIRKNPLRLIERFNAALSDLRLILNENNQSNDILFIMDGTEKIPYDIYMQLFCKDSYLIRAIDVNMIFSVPINSYFDIKGSPSSEFFQTFTLPMVPVTEQSIPLMKQIITKRIDENIFLEQDALTFCVKKSGGCIRQLIRILNRALIVGLGKKINREIAEKSVYELSRSMMDKLDSEHLGILKEKKFDTADQKVLDLLFSLVVLKYNGDRKINPLIEEADFSNV